MRNSEVMDKENHELLKKDLPIIYFYSLALNGSCDITNTDQLIIYVRYLNNTSAKCNKELLILLSLSGTTKGNDLYNAVMVYLKTEKLSLGKIFLLQQTVGTKKCKEYPRLLAFIKVLFKN